MVWDEALFQPFSALAAKKADRNDRQPEDAKPFACPPQATQAEIQPLCVLSPLAQNNYRYAKGNFAGFLSNQGIDPVNVITFGSLQHGTSKRKGKVIHVGFLATSDCPLP